jgi:hypothetical protein
MSTLAESLTWAAASLPFELMCVLQGNLGTVKKRLESFHNTPTGNAQQSGDHYRSHGERRFGLYKGELERAIDGTNNVLRGFTPAGRIDGPLPVTHQINKGIGVTTRVQNALYTIQNTLQASILRTDGVVASERAGALCVHACDVLTRAAAEIEACVKNALEVAAQPLPESTK